MTIAVDFDGTITERNSYPDICPFRKNAIKVLSILQSQGHDICLWTCRSGKELSAALKALKDCGFTPNYVNCGPWSTGSQKMVANLYIDDMSWPNAAFPEEHRIDWDEIAKAFSIPEELYNEVENGK